MVLFVLAFMLGTQGLMDYLSLRQYRSWNELPCETGSVTKIRVRTTGKGNSALTLVRAGVAHDFRGGALNYMTSELLQSLKGKEIRICYESRLYVMFPPHMTHDVSFVLSMDGAHSYYSPKRTFDDALSFREKTIRFFWVWINLPILLFLLVRHGRDAWRQRRLHVARLARIAARARQPDVVVQ